METEKLTMEEIEKRMSEIETEMNADDANLEALSAEVDALIERKIQIKTAADEKRSLKEKVAGLHTEPVEVIDEGEKEKMIDIKEFRNSKEYIDAFARYIKTGDDKECRALLTQNGEDGTVVVPELVENYINTAWERDDLVNRVRKTFIKGNLKVNFEISGTDAVVHAEGDEAVTEETLVLGIVTIVPSNVKKWISISDEVYEMGGEPFLDYIYDELAYRIVRKLGELVIAAITESPSASTGTEPAVASLQMALGAGTIVAAEALLSSEATDVVAIMNRGTWGALKALTITSGANVGDVFNGLPVVFTDALPSYADAEEEKPYIIVGDLKGVTMNFPAGDDIKFKFDDLTEATADMIRVIGRVYAGLAVTAPFRFAQVVKEESE